MKTINRLHVLFLAATAVLVFLPAKTPLLAEKTPVQDAIGETVTDLEGLWAEDACETVVVKKKGHPLASIACSGNFDLAQRARFLDVLFKHAFKLQTTAAARHVSV